MIGIGESIPDAEVWVTTRKRVTIAELAQKGPYLLLFYFADWTGT